MQSGAFLLMQLSSRVFALPQAARNMRVTAAQSVQAEGVCSTSLAMLGFCTGWQSSAVPAPARHQQPKLTCSSALKVGKRQVLLPQLLPARAHRHDHRRLAHPVRAHLPALPQGTGAQAGCRAGLAGPAAGREGKPVSQQHAAGFAQAAGRAAGEAAAAFGNQAAAGQEDGLG